MEHVSKVQSGMGRAGPMRGEDMEAWEENVHALRQECVRRLEGPLNIIFNDAEYSILWLCYHLANQFPIIGSQIVSRICFYKSLWQQAPRGPGLSLSNLYNTYSVFPTPGMVPGWRSLNTAANIICLESMFYYSSHYF